MTADTRDALSAIQRCLSAEKFAATAHFCERMERRGLFWPDVVALINDPAAVLNDGLDHFGRPNWRIDGNPASAFGNVEFVCASELSSPEWTAFLTLYWE